MKMKAKDTKGRKDKCNSILMVIIVPSLSGENSLILLIGVVGLLRILFTTNNKRIDLTEHLEIFILI